MANKKAVSLIPSERIEQRILLVRGQNVLLDADLAELYDITTGNLNKAVSRNRDRFPDDFMFQLTLQEFRDLQFHSGRASSWGGRGTPPHAFTEHGVAMLSSILKTEPAVRVSIAVIRTFVRLRRLIASHKGLARKLAVVEKKADHNYQLITELIRQLSAPPSAKNDDEPFGFRVSVRWVTLLWCLSSPPPRSIRRTTLPFG